MMCYAFLRVWMIFSICFFSVTHFVFQIGFELSVLLFFFFFLYLEPHILLVRMHKHALFNNIK